MMNPAPNPSPAPVPSESPAAGGRLSRWFSTKELLVALVLLFVITPFVEDLEHGKLIEIGLLTFVLLSALLAVGGRRGTLVVAVLLLVPALLGKWFEHFQPGRLPPWVFFGASLVFIGFVVVNLLRFILRTRQVTSDVLCAAITIYLLLGLLWASAYALVGRMSPGAFEFVTATDSHRLMDGFNAFYFSFVTLSTVGYGDIVPVSGTARMLAMMEAMTGTIYLAVLVARLVSLYSMTPAPTKTD